MKILEKRLLAYFVLAIVLIIGFVLSINWYSGMGDNATYSDISLNIARSGKSSSQVLSTIIDYIFNEKIVEATPEQIKNKEFPIIKSELNTLTFHFTPIQYLIAPLTKLMPVNIVWGNITGMSFVLMLAIGYAMLRRGGVPIILSLTIIIFMSLHPAWNDSLFGQIYVDRIFLFTSLALAYLVSSKKPKIQYVAIFAILSCLIIEKMSIITGIFLCLYALLYYKKIPIRTVLAFLFIGIVSGLFGFLIVKFYLNNDYYSSFLSISSILNYGNYLRTYPSALTNLYTFLLTNLPLLLIAIFDWRASLIAITMMIPNILGNLGGAEKTGWVTHYHTTYFPFLIWAAIMGFTRFYNLGWIKKNIWARYLVIGFFGLFYLYPFITSKTIRETWPLRSLWILQDYKRSNGKYANQITKEKLIHDTIPIGSSVSAPERYMIYLFQAYDVYYYPLGLDNTDFVVLDLDNDSKSLKYRGVYSYLGEEANREIDTILLTRLKEKGYDIDHPTTYQNMAIIARINKE